MKQFLVTEAAMRPASSEKKCFYCRKNIGAFHKDDCVLVKRDMKIRFSFEVTVDLPAAWTKENAEFHYNDSSWCSMNITGLLEQHMEQYNSCLCDIVHAEFVSQDPEEYLGES